MEQTGVKLLLCMGSIASWCRAALEHRPLLHLAHVRVPGFGCLEVRQVGNCVCRGINPWGWFAFSIDALCKQDLSIVSVIGTSVFDFEP